MARATFDEGDKARRIGRSLESPERALRQVGVLMVAESQRAFKAQGFGGKPWEARAPVNVFGIVADFAAGRKKPPARRFERRPALRDTGRLAASIAFQLVDPSTVEVGTVVDYAAVHQRGGTVRSAKITPSVRKALWSWLKKQDRSLKRQLGWILNRKFQNEQLEAEVPARPFVGITKETREIVRRSVGVEIMEAR